jgi:signal transduction histidine kinase
MLTVADEERQRVVRDLHDGAQQRLVAAVAILRAALGKFDPADREARALVEQALNDTQGANQELRDLVQGILPSSLSRSGLQGAVRILVGRATLPVRVDVPPDRFAPAIEATADFIISEALTNTFKHAHAQHGCEGRRGSRRAADRSRR